MKDERDDGFIGDLDKMRGSRPLGLRLEHGHSTAETDPMPPSLTEVTDFHQLRAELLKEHKGLVERTHTLEIALIGTDVRPGVYAMVYKMNAEMALLRQDIKDDRNARELAERDRKAAAALVEQNRTHQERFRDGVMIAMAVTLGVCAVAVIVGLFMMN